MQKFQNKYRIKSARLQEWDYSWNAAYYVTICTNNRECYLGEILNGEMKMSEIGKIADKYWNNIPEHFPFVLLDEHVVMPNHIHGIIKINKPDSGDNNVETPKLGVSTLQTPTKHNQKNKWNPGNLGVIINQYKRICTINARKMNPDFAWQPRFYDHVIRNDESLAKIRIYIKDNIKNWSSDQFNPDFEETK